MALRIAFISDLHLTRRSSLFQYNWEIVVNMIGAEAPDLVVCGGDISYDGPASPDDLAYAREQLDRLAPEVLCIPGNHDIGDRDVGHTPVEMRFVEQYRDVFGSDFWVAERGGWRLIGLNSQLFGSGLPAEAEQMAMLRDTLAIGGDRPVGVFCHKTLHLGDPATPVPAGWTIPEAERHELRKLLLDHGVRFYGSGHFHRFREIDDAPMQVVWAPSTAFITAHPKFAARGGLPKVGFARLELDEDGSVSAAFAETNAMIQIDFQNAINDGGAEHKRWMERYVVRLERPARALAEA